MLIRRLKATFLLVFVAAPLVAQYIPPGSTLSSGALPPEEEMYASLDEAPWRLGSLRLSPWIGLRDFSLVLSSDREGVETGTDLTMTAGAGLRGYVKTGKKVIWAGHVLPEYVTWQEAKSKERLNGRYGVGVFTYFNRLDLELSWRRDESQAFFSPEIQELTTTRRDVGRFVLDLGLTERLSIVGETLRQETSNQEEETTLFGRLDNVEDTASLRLRYRRSGWSAALGVEDGATDFEAEGRDLSHTGSTGFFSLGYRGVHFAAQLNVGRQSLRPRSGADLVGLDATTGNVETFWELGRESSLFLYGRRSVGYSVRSHASTVLAERFGSRLNVALSDAQLGLVVEAGEDEYLDVATAQIGRVDAVLTYGASLRLNLRGFGVQLSAHRTDYDSNLDGFDRDVTTWSAMISTDAIKKFALGDGDRVW